MTGQTEAAPVLAWEDPLILRDMLRIRNVCRAGMAAGFVATVVGVVGDWFPVLLAGGVVFAAAWGAYVGAAETGRAFGRAVGRLRDDIEEALR